MYPVINCARRNYVALSGKKRVWSLKVSLLKHQTINVQSVFSIQIQILSIPHRSKYNIYFFGLVHVFTLFMCVHLLVCHCACLFLSLSVCVSI